MEKVLVVLTEFVEFLKKSNSGYILVSLLNDLTRAISIRKITESKVFDTYLAWNLSLYNDNDRLGQLLNFSVFS